MNAVARKFRTVHGLVKVAWLLTAFVIVEKETYIRRCDRTSQDMSLDIIECFLVELLISLREQRKNINFASIKRERWNFVCIN